MKKPRKPLLLLSVLVSILFVPQIAEASHSVSHKHSAGTQYHVRHQEVIYYDGGCEWYVKVHDANYYYYDMYYHKYVTFDVWYNESYSYAGYDWSSNGVIDSYWLHDMC